MRTIDVFRDALGETSVVDKTTGEVRRYTEILDQAPKVRMQQAADYWTVNEQALDPVRDLPNIAPPWPVFYFEYRIKLSRWAVGLPEEMAAPVLSSMPDAVEIAGMAVSKKLNDGKWDVAVHMLAFSGGQPLATGALEYSLHPDGRPEVTPDGKMIYRNLTSPRRLYALSDSGLSFLSPMFLAMCFCHCKAQVEIKTEEIPPKLAKKQAEKGRARVDRWHVLDIGPVRKLLESARRAGDTGIKQALHLCRGHFRDYKDGRGLFGKYHGVYWVAPQIKGNPDRGRVTKDYNVTAPSTV